MRVRGCVGGEVGLIITFQIAAGLARVSLWTSAQVHGEHCPAGKLPEMPSCLQAGICGMGLCVFSARGVCSQWLEHVPRLEHVSAFYHLHCPPCHPPGYASCIWSPAHLKAYLHFLKSW